MKHYQCFLRRHSDGGRVLIMKISYIVIGVFGFLVFISFVITLKQSLYSNRSKIINRKVLFWLKNDAGHYPTRKKINGKEIAEDATFEVIKNFLE